MSRWLLLADPKSYGIDNLIKSRDAVWDGITGSAAQKHLRGFKKGDRALIYHTAPDKAVMGSATITSGPYPDPSDAEGKRVVVDIRAGTRFRKPVPLESLRENARLAGMAFLKIQRIAISPVSEAEYEEIVRMGQ
jgi:predicted RNA-binding protein with PUA-like domain